MFPTNFDYTRAGSVREAVALLAKNPEAKLIAGGHSLLPAMKLRLAQPALLVDISRIAELKGVSKGANGWTIGALTTHAEVSRADVPNALKTAAGLIGDVQVRNRGTIGGSISHADPAADYPAVLIALGASIKVAGPRGERTISANDLFTDLFTTAIEAGEVLTAVTIPARAANSASAYIKHPHPASGYAVAGVAAAIQTDGKGACAKASIAVTGACVTARRLPAAEAALTGKALNAASIKAAAGADKGLECLSDNYASAAYRANLVSVLTRRALEACASDRKA
ncbi:MAG: xanthine dehydrogenase family protein subunit M [Chloroflexi bacterium]|nr:xanthine dehydrogenase family protein subunit M [Chloroflexota bacterium]